MRLGSGFSRGSDDAQDGIGRDDPVAAPVGVQEQPGGGHRVDGAPQDSERLHP
jgi:hypothetical protein